MIGLLKKKMTARVVAENTDAKRKINLAGGAAAAESLKLQPAIKIETTSDEPRPNDGETNNWRDYKRMLGGKIIPDRKKNKRSQEAYPRLQEKHFTERHHQQYGRPWIVGAYIFSILKSEGLLPEQSVVDIGCGSGRLGLHLIRYLETGKYFGIDVHYRSLAAFSAYELPLHALSEKKPRLLWNSKFDMSHFGTQFDVAIDISTTLHLSRKSQICRAYENTRNCLKDNGRFFLSPTIVERFDLLKSVGFKIEKVVDVDLSELNGFDFDPNLSIAVLLKT